MLIYYNFKLINYNEKSIIMKNNLSLNDLFEEIPPNELRKNLQELFFGYVINKQGVWPLNFPDMSGNIYSLMIFLDDLDEST